MATYVTVIARARAKQGQEKRLREELERVLAPTRVEAGCINYDLHQSPSDPHDFLFHENWVSAEHLDAHLKSPHILALFELLPSLIDGPAEITTWTRVG